jgi:hypothetical protein
VEKNDRKKHGRVTFYQYDIYSKYDKTPKKFRHFNNRVITPIITDRCDITPTKYGGVTFHLHDIAPIKVCLYISAIDTLHRLLLSGLSLHRLGMER